LSSSRLFKRANRRWVEVLEDEDDEQDQNEDRCADADVHVLPLVALGADTHSGARPSIYLDADDVIRSNVIGYFFGDE
jgi:hypothetical protein